MGSAYRAVLALATLILLSHVWSALELAMRPEHGRGAPGREIAPPAGTTREAVVRVYAARGWLTGVAAVHSWIAMKRSAASSYDRYEVTPAGLRRNERPADSYWDGSAPRVLVEHRGPAAEPLIDALESAIQAYPHKTGAAYRLWPGPNSNTFVAYLGRRVPDLGLELPPTAIGKDYLVPGRILGRTPSGTGYQIALFGVAGGAVGVLEGLELHVLGMTIGIDPLDLAVKLPGVGQRGVFQSLRAEPAGAAR